jgi:hypothetical protein
MTILTRSRWTPFLLLGATAVALTAWSSATGHSAPPPSQVTVTNPAADPVLVRVLNNQARPVPVQDVDQPARSPFQKKVRIDLPAGQCCENGFVDVPAGKRLVIEYASALGLGSPGEAFNFEVGTILNGHLAFDENHLLPVAQQQEDGTSVAGQVVRIYADPGPSRVMLRASRSGAGAAVAFMTVSGHLVSLP